MQTTIRYDVFISYRWVNPDMSWVRESLVPALESAGVRALLDVVDFVPGRDLVLEMERASRESRHVLSILTPAYFEGDRMVSFESLSARRRNPSGSDSRLVPFLLCPTPMPDWIRGLIPIDWTNEQGRIREWTKLLKLLGASKSSDPPPGVPAPSLSQEATVSHATLDETKVDAESIVRSGPFEAYITSENRGNILKYRLAEQRRLLRYSDVIELWQHSQAFVDFQISLFKKCGFHSYVWETPSLRDTTLDHIFEFVLCNVPAASPSPDRDAYAAYFDMKTASEGIVTFPNLGGDALLVTPSPMRPTANYANLPAFFKEAPLGQQRALWSELGKCIQSRLSDQPLWVSVAAGGIAWLHIRLDSVPKYYRYVPYSS